MALEKSGLDTANNTTKYKVSELVQWFANPAFKQAMVEFPDMFKWKRDIFLEWNIAFAQYPFIQIALRYLMKEITPDIIYGPDVPEIVESQLGPFKMEDMLPEFFMPTLTERKWEDWNRGFYFRLINLLPNEKMTRAAFRDWLRAFGVYVYRELPDSNTTKSFKQWEADYNKWMETTMKIQRIGNFLHTITLFVVAITLPVSSPAMLAAQQKLKDSAKELISIDNLTELGTQVLIDTANDFLTQQRRDMIDFLEDLDDKTSLNLDSVVSEVAGITRDAIEGINEVIRGLTMAFVEGVQNKIKGVDKAVAETESEERQALEEIQQSGGLGVAMGLKRLLFNVKKGT